MRRKTIIHFAQLAALFTRSALAQGGDLVPVIARPVSRTLDLPGELEPYFSVSLHARVAGYVERISVDRGSVVKQGQMLVELSAPEMKAQIAEAESRVQAAESERAQAQADLAAAESTYERLKKASETPGAVAGNELVQVEKRVEAARALVRSREQASRVAEAAVQARRDVESYLRITAPFDGVVTERLVHPGALVGPGADAVLVVIQQVARLRLVVPVPESDVGGTVAGANVSFAVPAYPDRTFSGKVSRISHALDQKTRTMPVELDVINRESALAPGMYAGVKWPVRRSRPALFVPKTSVVTTTERTFVIRDRNGTAEWVDVRKGATEGDLIEVIGNLRAGDRVVRRGSDELCEGAVLQARAK